MVLSPAMTLTLLTVVAGHGVVGLQANQRQIRLGKEPPDVPEIGRAVVEAAIADGGQVALHAFDLVGAGKRLRRWPSRRRSRGRR